MGFFLRSISYPALASEVSPSLLALTGRRRRARCSSLRGFAPMTPGRAACPSCYITTFPIWCWLHLGWPRLGVVIFGERNIWNAHMPQRSQPCAARHHPPILARPTNHEPPSLLLMPLPSLLDLCPPGSTPFSSAPQTRHSSRHSTPLLYPAPNRIFISQHPRVTRSCQLP